MLAINFKLTPAQTKLLLQLAFYDYTQLAEDLLVIPRRDGVPDMFIVTVKCLQSRGLVEHVENDWPHHRITESGMALANMIVRECRDVVKLADSTSDRLKTLEKGIQRCKSDAKARELRSKKRVIV